MSTTDNDRAAPDTTSMDRNSPEAASADKALSAILASAVIVAGFVAYWVLEIDAAREMLKLAYG